MKKSKIDYTKYTIYEFRKAGDNRSNDYTRIFISIDDFINFNPPCKECLIQSMCVIEKLEHPTLDSLPNHLRIKLCDKLTGFMVNHESFSRH